MNPRHGPGVSGRSRSDPLERATPRGCSFAWLGTAVALPRITMTNSPPWQSQQVTISIVAPTGHQCTETCTTWQGLTYLGSSDAPPVTVAVAALFQFPADRLQASRELSGPGFAFHKPRCKCSQCRSW